MKTAAVVDGWELMRSGVESTLRRCGATVVSSVTTATEFFGVLSRPDKTVDIVVIGHIDDMTQTVALNRAAQVAGLSVIVLTTTVSPSAVMELCAAGAHAVAGREASSSDLLSAINAVMEGRRYVASELLHSMFDAKTQVPIKPSFDLTTREREVLAQLAAGKSNTEISCRLSIGTETVKSHLTSIYDKLDVRRRTHAVSLAVTHGLV